MTIDLDSLNDNQRRAVLWNDGPLLVLAGPGSGKTRVLTMRVARLLEEQENASVLALTFTNSAAAEMRERVDQLLGQRGDRAHLGTFHSFAIDILRQHGSHIGLKPDFSLLTQSGDRLAVLEPVAKSLEAAGHSDIPSDRRNLLTLLDHLFAESYDGGLGAPGFASAPEWLSALFERYCKALIAANRLDFGSLLSLARRLLSEKPGVARVSRLGWTHVCVDEFQDTNKAQYDLLKLIVVEQQPNLFVVGDDDQIIYQWNGASPERLQALRTEYEMEVVQLPENYRCPPEIVSLANKLIAHNRLRTTDKKPLEARRPPSTNGRSVIRYKDFPTPEEEAAAVAADIRARGVDPSECVVLARTNRLLEEVAPTLRAKGLDPYLARRKNDFETPIVRVAINALRLANARHDREILRRLCVAWSALAEVTIEVEDVAAGSAVVGGDFLRTWVDLAAPDADDNLATFVHKLRTALVERLEFPGVVDWFLQEGWVPWKDEQDSELQEEIEIWTEFHGQYVREHGSGGSTLNAYLQSMDLTSKVPPPPASAVRCLTVPGSKGLEFKHVYLIGMAQEVLPSFQALKKGPNSREVEEERRNCFVAITRAQESLMLTRAHRYHGWAKRPSQFLEETGLEPS